jgi:hypothetical protein
MHTTMQMLGRVAIIGGTVLVSLANVAMFQGSRPARGGEGRDLPAHLRAGADHPAALGQRRAAGGMLKRREARRLATLGRSRADHRPPAHDPEEQTTPNWWILGGSAVFVALTITVGLSGIEYGQEIIFAPRSPSSAS